RHRRASCRQGRAPCRQQARSGAAAATPAAERGETSTTPFVAVLTGGRRRPAPSLPANMARVGLRTPYIPIKFSQCCWAQRRSVVGEGNGASDRIRTGDIQNHNLGRRNFLTHCMLYSIPARSANALMGLAYVPADSILFLTKSAQTSFSPCYTGASWRKPAH